MSGVSQFASGHVADYEMVIVERSHKSSEDIAPQIGPEIYLRQGCDG